MSAFDLELRQQVIDNELQLIGNSKNVLIINSNPELFEKLLHEKECEVEILKIDADGQFNESTKNTINDIENFNFSVLNNKTFQVILLDNSLENLSNPKRFLKGIQKFLSDDGYLVCSSYNIYNSINRIKFLDGNINSSDSIFEKKQLLFSSLDNILLTLSETDFSISKLLRVEKEITFENQTELKNFVLPEELLKSISADPESKTFFYAFSFSPNSNVDYVTRKWITKFSKNLVTEGLEEILNKFKQSNREQFSLIQHLEQSLQDKDAYQAQAFKDKDVHYKKIIDKIAEDKDAQLDAIKNSFAYKTMKKLDKIFGKDKKN